MHLLVSLGAAWPVVPEAFLRPGPTCSEVHVLTTGAEKVDDAVRGVRRWFAAHAPDVLLTVTRLRGVPDITSAADHEAFEEVLFRWIAARRHAAVSQGNEVHVCLAGGFKTMSAAMQQAAELFGCDSLFHVLADRNPADADAIEAALRDATLHWIELGPRAGWPEFRHLDPAAYPLLHDAEGDWTSPPPPAERTLRRRIQDSLHRFQRIAAHWDSLEDLPFRALAALPEPDLAWLREPLRPDDPADRAWVAALPKVELHCHLGGFATSGTALEQVRAAAERPERLPPLRDLPPPEGWPLPGLPCGLPAYMRLGDNSGSTLLRDPGCLRRHIALLYDHLRAEHVVHAEIRCSPGNYADPACGRSAWDVLADITATFDACRDAAGPDGPSVHLLLIATRREAGDFRTGISRHLALAATAAEHGKHHPGCRVVGVDLAGFEDPSTRPHYFREDFTAVHRAGLAVTVHAGENDDAEAIWSAVFDLNARRIGHGLHLVHSPALLEVVAARGIGIELCPYANLQIVGFPLDATADRATYPLPDFLRHGIPVTVNTDNIGISGAGLTDNLLLAARLSPGLTRLDVLRLLAHAARTSFLPEPDRRRLTARLGDALGPLVMG